MEFLGALEAEKLTKQKWAQYCGTPCISFMFEFIIKENSMIQINFDMKYTK